MRTSTRTGPSTRRRTRPSGRAVLAVVLTVLMLSSAVPPVAQGVHDDAFHGAEVPLSNVRNLFYLHCVADLTQECASDRTFMARDVGSAATDLHIVNGDADSPVTFGFRDQLTGRETVLHDGELRSATATLYLSSPDSTPEFRVRLLVNGDEVAKSGTQNFSDATNDAAAGEVGRFTFTLAFPDPARLRRGDGVTVEISGQAEQWTLYLHVRNDQLRRDSRIELRGQLMSLQAWLEPAGGGDKSVFNLQAPEADRRFRPWLVVRPSLGKSVLWDFGDVHDDEGAPDEPPSSPGAGGTPSLSIRRIDPPQLSSLSCAGVFEYDRNRSGVLQPDETFVHLDVDVFRFNQACTIPEDDALRGTYRFSFRQPSPLSKPFCGTANVCQRDLTVDLITRLDIQMGLDDDEAVKEVLAGETVHYNLQLTNRISSAVSLTLSTTDPPPGWTVGLSRTEVTLAAGATRDLIVRMTPPSTAPVNAEATVVLSAQAAEVPQANPDPLALSAIVAADATAGVTVTPTETAPATAVLGRETALFFEVTNRGTATDTFRYDVAFAFPADPDSVGGIVADHRAGATLEPGERDTLRVGVTVPGDLDPDLLQEDITAVLRARSDADAAVFGTGQRVLRAVGTYAFNATLLDTVHLGRVVVPPAQQQLTACASAAAQTTWGSWFRVTVNNTGGNPDRLLFNDVEDPRFWTPVGDEDVANWQVAVYRSPDFGGDVDMEGLPTVEPITDRGVRLPAGGQATFFVLILRDQFEEVLTGRDDQTQCSGDPLDQGDGLKVRLVVRSANRTEVTQTLFPEFRGMTNGEAAGDASASDERHRVLLEALDEPAPDAEDDRFVVHPGQARTFTYRVTNTGNYKCGNDGWRFFLSRPLPPWQIEVVQDPDGDGVPLTSGIDGAPDNSSVTYNHTFVGLRVRVAGNASAGQLADAEVTVRSACTTKIGPQPDPAANPVQDVLPLRLRVGDGFSVDVRPERTQLSVNPGGSVLFNVAIANTNTTRLRAEVGVGTAGMPAGWSGGVEGLATITVPAFRTAHVPVRIAAPSDAQIGDGAVMDVRVEAESLDPATAATVGGIVKSTTVLAEVADPAGVRIDVPVGVKAVEPGDSRDYAFTVVNERSDSAEVTVCPSLTAACAGGAGNATRSARADLPPGWTATVLEDSGGTVRDVEGPITLAGGASRDLILRIEAPVDALNVTTVATQIQARARGGAAVASVKTHVAGSFGVDLSADRASRAVPSGAAATYLLTVRNEGNGVDTLQLDHEDPPEGWTATLSASELVLAAGETGHATFTVTPPRNARPGALASLQMTATSAGDPQTREQLTIRTSVARFDVRLLGQPPTLRVAPGEPATFTFDVLNNGTGLDIVNMGLRTGPQGWTARFSDPAPQLEPGERRTLQATVTPAANAPPARVVVVLEAQSALDPSTTASLPFTVVVVDYVARDVDDDGILEAAVDRDGTLANGYESFVETDPSRGIASSQVLAVDGDGDGLADFLIDTAGQGQATAYWSPSTGVFTRATLADATGDGRAESFFDYDGDGIVDAVHLPVPNRANPATSFDLDNDLTDEYLVDTTGNGQLDTYVDTGQPRPGQAVRTRTTLIAPSTYAVDIDGDGSHDRVVDVKGRTVKAFGPLDALTQLVGQYWYVLVLLLIVVVLFVGVKVSVRRR